MRRIQVLGTGCAKCKALAANAETAIRAGGVDAQVENVKDIREIMKYGVMTTPALAVDGRVKSVGRVLSAEEIRDLITCLEGAE